MLGTRGRRSSSGLLGATRTISGVKTERGSAGEEDLEGVGGGTQEQLTVSKTSPGLLLDGTNVVASQFVHELPRQLLIEQDAHGPSVLHGQLPRRPPPARARR